MDDKKIEMIFQVSSPSFRNEDDFSGAVRYVWRTGRKLLVGSQRGTALLGGDQRDEQRDGEEGECAPPRWTHDEKETASVGFQAGTAGRGRTGSSFPCTLIRSSVSGCADAGDP